MIRTLPSGIRIRLASPDEAQDIATMSRDHIEEGLDWTWTPERVERAIAGSQTNVAVAGNGSGLVGFGIMAYVDSVAHLMLLAVREGCRRKGIGTSIVEWLEKVARAAGIELIRVEARADNVAALSMYAACGYRERSRVPGMYSGIEDGVRLEKDLSLAVNDWIVSLLHSGATLNLKDIITDGYARFVQYKDGFLLYVVTVPATGKEFSFPVPIRDAGAGPYEALDRAVVFMPFIRKAIADGTFLPFTKPDSL